MSKSKDGYYKEIASTFQTNIIRNVFQFYMVTYKLYTQLKDFRNKIKYFKYLNNFV